MTVIVLVGFPFMNWNMGMGSRYLFVVMASTAVTLITYDLFVRRWRVARFLFGMKGGREDSRDMKNDINR